MTAVVLSFNRQEAMRKQLLFFQNKPIHLILADGSEEDWGSGKSGSFGRMTWEYFRISGENSFRDRFNKAVDMVKTECMLFIDDEECILWTGIEKALQFLIQNPDHSCAGGRVARIYLGGKGKPPQSNRLSIGDWNDYSSDFELLEDAPQVRLKNLIVAGRTANIYYQVVLTKYIKEFVVKVRERSFVVPYIGSWEILLCGFLITRGKWKMGGYPFWFRYGGSVVSASRPPLVMTETDAREVARLLRIWSEEIIDWSAASNRYRKFELEFISILMATYGSPKAQKFGANGKYLRVQQFLPKHFLLIMAKCRNQFKFRLFELLPSLYEILIPTGVERLSKYARLNSGGDVRIAEDLRKMEQIWTNYPLGISESRFREEVKNS